jgi:hypothetical protein
MAPARANRFTGTMVILAAMLTAAGCTTVFEQRLAEAEHLRAEAAAAGAEWLQTEALLDQARDEAARGDTDAALALVDKARFQSEAALRQAEYEATAWQDRVIK